MTLDHPRPRLQGASANEQGQLVDGKWLVSFGKFGWPVAGITEISSWGPQRMDRGRIPKYESGGCDPGVLDHVLLLLLFDDDL